MDSLDQLRIAILNPEFDLHNEAEKKFFSDAEIIMTNFRTFIYKYYRVQDATINTYFTWHEKVNAKCVFIDNDSFEIFINKGVVNIGIFAAIKHYDIERPLWIGKSVMSMETISLFFLSFIYAHELFHALHGHLGFMRHLGKELNSQQRTAMEYDADLMAVAATYRFLQHRLNQHFNEDEIREIVFISVFWPIRMLSENIDYRGSLEGIHPDLILRLRFIMIKLSSLDNVDLLGNLIDLKLSTNRAESLARVCIECEERYLEKSGIPTNKSKLLQHFLGYQVEDFSMIDCTFKNIQGQLKQFRKTN